MFLDQLAKLFEQDRRVVRARRSFGMILDAEDRFNFVTHAFDGVVVEVDAIDFDVAGKRIGVHREAVILGSDFDFAGLQIFDWLIGAAMAEL